MDLQGKTVVLMGRFHGLSQAEAKAGLEALGARVTKTVSSKTDLIFRSHDVAGRKIGKASQLGIPIYDWNTLRALLKRAAEASAGVEPGTDEPSSFMDHAALASAADPDSLLGVLREADWSAFVAERDLLPLRNRLQEWERTHGVSEVHRFATERIRSLGSTRLQQPFRHFTEISDHAISPCGCYLATGSWCGDDYHRGGALQIWEIASGRCVNVLDRIEGGVGWPGHTNTLQWSADSRRVGLAYNTNQIGVFDPFDDTTHTYPIASASVTNGGNRPPDWALAPDGRSAFIESASSCAIKGCVVPLEAGDLFWLPEDAPPRHPYLLTETLPAEFGQEGDELWPEDVSWSRDGSRLLAYDAGAKRRRTFAIDLPTKQMYGLTKEERKEANAWHGASAGGATGQVRVSVGGTGVTFHRADTGGVLSHFEFLREPPEPRCVEHEYGFDHHPVNFALDDDTWCAAFEEGVVIAPPDRREDLEAVLAWSVDRRFAWPVRWGGLTIVPDAKDAAELLGQRGLGTYVRQYVEQRTRDAETNLQTPDDKSWPPPNTATLHDLFAAARDSVSELRSSWNHHVCEHLRHAARLRARRGEVSGAVDMLDAIPEPDDRVAAFADVAMILARAGRADEARAFLAEVEAGAEAALGPYNVADVASSVGGAYEAMGNTAAADVWFARARDAIEPEANAWQNRLTVSWALTECGREDEARALWARGEEEWRETPSTFYSVPWLLYLLGTGRIDLAEEFLTACDVEWDWPMDPVIGVLADLGRTDLFRLGRSDVPEFLAELRYEKALRMAEQHTRRAHPATPSEADLAALAEAHAELLRTPRAHRERPTELLIDQAAECGHLSAVLDLLGKLPSPRDFNGRPSSAFSALWRAATGQDVAPW
ncbi:BRCT domain-containing protein [Streptomyces sp. NPDC048483]|uniref:BRCT domain-containing protein n=1 Tax=Streptomyces sp. NPDC048483 TaxID=3154927 RepID=UPI003422D014